MVEALAGKRGAQRRARRRREYRLWRRFNIKVRGKRVDPAPLAPARSSQAARSNARWFRNAILWQQQLRRRKRRKVVNSPTIPPLQYQSCIKVGTLNVKKFAETLKLKSALILMQTHSIDVLMLTETRSNSYYSYQSEGYMVILSGNIGMRALEPLWRHASDHTSLTLFRCLRGSFILLLRCREETFTRSGLRPTLRFGPRGDS